LFDERLFGIGYLYIRDLITSYVSLITFHESRITNYDLRLTMDIKELTELMHTFVRSKGWYEPDSKRPQTPRNLAISLSLEANEVLEHFQWQEGLNEGDELASELADVTLYLLQLASVSGVDLEQAVLKKLETNAHRYWD
jgi:NTP pyrophosphatase (non-canonical NTP hydrolase)